VRLNDASRLEKNETEGKGRRCRQKKRRGGEAGRGVRSDLGRTLARREENRANVRPLKRFTRTGGGGALLSGTDGCRAEERKSRSLLKKWPQAVRICLAGEEKKSFYRKALLLWWSSTLDNRVSFTKK